MLPPAAFYLLDYISHSDESALLARIDSLPWRGDLKRRVQHYGYRYDYKARRVTHDSYLGPLPNWLNFLTDRLRVEGVFSAVPDQVIVNEYLPGQGIAAHVDCEPCFGNTIASLSLGSASMMEFSSVHSGEATSCYLQPRSLLILRDEARFDWKHGIPARKSDLVGGERYVRGRRVSLTFRTIELAR
ncbi:alpha-ketoglutarate-dependent dioxygenase AlkB [Stappia sp. F7233]|uniref:Alpha-ketoglutarate-dependent dioxygenase AlkB n=1 Tax=Stappia albiluteola TaxID=2758565 RepID=A0A839A7Z1_9HYPH|nr:alpha-ketoglutarate-dependent dioxygenase AlkB [Stappia albiluteola]MBA5775680.1 alpha-ketoglutarate-dependent dioxygenase AlkB [Stappia albiluteola]